MSLALAAKKTVFWCRIAICHLSLTESEMEQDPMVLAPHFLTCLLSMEKL